MHKIYTVRDRKAEYCLPVFSAKSDTDAIRSFTETVVSSDTDMSKYPADFDLLAIAEFDIQIGFVKVITPYQILINGLVAIQQANELRSRYKKALDGQLDIEDFTSPSDAA